MIEFIVLIVLFIITFGLFGLVYLNDKKSSQKQIKELLEQIAKDREMLLAGSLQEYKNVMSGGKISTNEVKEEPNSAEITESLNVPMEEIANVQIDDQPSKKVKIYR